MNGCFDKTLFTERNLDRSQHDAAVLSNYTTLDGVALRWFESYLSNRSQKVNGKGELSAAFILAN